MKLKIRVKISYTFKNNQNSEVTPEESLIQSFKSDNCEIYSLRES